jgi:hypothetical protein
MLRCLVQTWSCAEPVQRQRSPVHHWRPLGKSRWGQLLGCSCALHSSRMRTNGRQHTRPVAWHRHRSRRTAALVVISAARGSPRVRLVQAHAPAGNERHLLSYAPPDMSLCRPHAVTHHPARVLASCTGPVRNQLLRRRPAAAGWPVLLPARASRPAAALVRTLRAGRDAFPRSGDNRVASQLNEPGPAARSWRSPETRFCGVATSVSRVQLNPARLQEGERPGAAAALSYVPGLAETRLCEWRRAHARAADPGPAAGVGERPLGAADKPAGGGWGGWAQQTCRAADHCSPQGCSSAAASGSGRAVPGMSTSRPVLAAYVHRRQQRSMAI